MHGNRKTAPTIAISNISLTAILLMVYSLLETWLEPSTPIRKRISIKADETPACVFTLAAIPPLI